MDQSIDPSGNRVLGHNQQRQGSELHAGARAQMIPSPVTHALSTMRGRVSARALTTLFYGRTTGMLNYIALRPFAMMEAVRMALANYPDPHPLVLDPQAGYSPQLIWQAAEMPEVEFLEIDLPYIIKDRQERLSGIPLPPNYQMLAADLSQTPLHEVLEGKRPAVIMVPGSYVSHADYRELLAYLRHIIAMNGSLISTFADARGIENLKANSALFARFAGEPIGMIHNENDLRAIFDQANYQINQICTFSELARKLKKPLPADIEILVISQPRS